MRFVHNLLPLLSSSPSSRIVSIHGAGKEGHLNEADLELKHTFTVRTARLHTCTMNTLALTEIASSYPSISCIHVFPGLVVTGAFVTFAEDWYLPLRFLFVWVVLPFAKLFTVSLQESGERHLFHATSARYPPAGVRDPPGGGVALPNGVEVARGADWREGSGCYLLIWEHTQEVFDRVVGTV